MTRWSKTLPHYRVEADRRTGDWLTEPEYTGDVDRDAHLARQDNDAEHYDTHEFGNGHLPETRTTAAITIVWRDDSTTTKD